MKIGILTFHDADNYGAVLQAYALKEAVKSMEADVEIIDYKQPYIIKDYKIFTFNKKLLVRSIISNFIYFYTKVVKKLKFNSFRKKYLSISKEKYDTSSEINGKDIYIVGSDQIWNTNITNYDSTFFLDFCNKNHRKISYAASIGKDIVNNDDIKFFKDHLNHIDYISVREKSSIDILRDLTDKEVKQCIDPVFLLNRNVWDRFVDSKINFKYLLVYRLSDNEEVLKAADILSKKLNLRVMYINDSIRKDRYGFHKVKRVGPTDFLSLIKNASFIVTDSFHGTAFSIIFNKDFITIPYKTRGNRMTGLLQLLNLDDRIINYIDEIKDNYNYKIDYSIPNKILNQERMQSLDFLRQAINSK